MQRSPFADLDPDAIEAKLIALGSDWADKLAAASLLEETQKTVLARITLDRLPTSGTHAAAERMAQASNDYREHVGRMVEARREANRARVRLDAAKVWADLVRSENSNRRAELQHLSGFAGRNS